MKDKAFAIETMGKYFRTDDKEVLDETTAEHQDRLHSAAVSGGHSGLLQDLERTTPKAKTAKPEELIDNRLVREMDQSRFVKALLAGK